MKSFFFYINRNLELNCTKSSLIMYRNKCIHSDSSVSITDCTLVNSISLVDELMWRSLPYIYVLWRLAPAEGSRLKMCSFH